MMSSSVSIYMIVLLSVSFPIGMSWVRASFNLFTRIIYILATTWLGTAFLLFLAVLAADAYLMLSALGLPYDGFIVGIVVLMMVFFAVVYSIINARLIRVKRANLKLDTSLRNVVQISDIHIGAINGHRFLRRIVDRTNSLSPDLVLITGDLVDGSAKLSHSLLSPLKDLDAPAYFVTGNHENYEGAEEMKSLVDEVGIEVISDEVIWHEDICIAGIDNPLDSEKDKSKVLRSLDIPRDRPVIFLSHLPIGFDIAAKKGVSLMLSGHTHAGQMFPFGLLAKMVYGYSYGLYRRGSSRLYVTSGAGTWGPPMRFLTRSEIVKFEIKN